MNDTDRAIDLIVKHAMALHHCAKDSALPKGKGLIGKLLRACARLEKVKKTGGISRPSKP